MKIYAEDNEQFDNNEDNYYDFHKDVIVYIMCHDEIFWLNFVSLKLLSFSTWWFLFDVFLFWTRKRCDQKVIKNTLSTIQKSAERDPSVFADMIQHIRQSSHQHKELLTSTAGHCLETFEQLGQTKSQEILKNPKILLIIRIRCSWDGAPDGVFVLPITWTNTCLDWCGRLKSSPSLVEAQSALRNSVVQ